MENVKLSLAGLARYYGREGQISFILHRLTGIGTVVFLLIHIVDTATVYFYPSLYEHAIALYRSIPFLFGEIFLVFSLIYHGINGARIALFDLVFPGRWNIPDERKSVTWTLGISIVLWLPAAIWMVRNVIVHGGGA